jgi:hypothetical protein
VQRAEFGQKDIEFCLATMAGTLFSEQVPVLPTLCFANFPVSQYKGI